MREDEPVAVVLGAGRERGLGAAISRRLRHDGARVLVADLAEGTELEQVAASLGPPAKAQAVACDVRDSAPIRTVFERARGVWGRVDTLVYSVGIGHVITPLSQLDRDAWNDVLAINLTGAFESIRWGAEAIRATRGTGRIVVVASIGGRRGSPLLAAYNASKHGLLGLVRSSAAELGPDGITVNAVCPNHVTTDMGATQNALLSERRGQSLDDYLAAMRQRIPLGRLATAEDVAGACSFLVSEDAAFITGVALDVNGGEFMG